MRLHGSRFPWREIENALVGSGADNEIWSFGEKVFEICKKYILLREKLRGYVREQMQRAHDKGTPVIRPLMYDFPADPQAWETEDAYMFGGDLLVAPVMEKGALKRNVYLPAGTDWVNVWTKERFAGGQTVSADAPLDVIPVFCRQGAAALACFT